MKTDGLVALVTGANKGLGGEVVRELARKGMNVYLGSRDRERGRQAAADFVRENLAVSVIELDVTDLASVARAAAQITNDYGHLDVLINNAGIHVGAPAPGAADCQYRKHDGFPYAHVQS
jgi:NAD(P)-dependent dehydrogenase (short-subunit alcohol dehydrogenase family)